MADPQTAKRIDQAGRRPRGARAYRPGPEGRRAARAGSAVRRRTRSGPVAHPQPRKHEVLLEAMPAAVGILDHGALVYVNAAFAYAFGYRSAAELIEAGGLDALLADGASLGSAERRGAQRSGRCAHPLAPQAQDRLRGCAARSRARRQAAALGRPGSLDAEPAPITASGGYDRLWRQRRRAVAAEARRRTETDAGGRLDFLAKVSHEVRTPLNSIIGFSRVDVAGAARRDRQRAL